MVSGGDVDCLLLNSTPWCRYRWHTWFHCAHVRSFHGPDLVNSVLESRSRLITLTCVVDTVLGVPFLWSFSHGTPYLYCARRYSHTALTTRTPCVLCDYAVTTVSGIWDLPWRLLVPCPCFAYDDTRH
ncbi:hypothetical protein BJV82DRAFT_633173, partial [Fennellomyces sp. T-0311]